MRDEDIRIYRSMVNPGEKFAGKTRVLLDIFNLNDKRPFLRIVIKNTPRSKGGVHAEEHLKKILVHAKDKHIDLTKFKFVVYMNFGPCANCCTVLVDMLLYIGFSTLVEVNESFLIKYHQVYEIKEGARNPNFKNERMEGWDILNRYGVFPMKIKDEEKQHVGSCLKCLAYKPNTDDSWACVDFRTAILCICPKQPILHGKLKPLLGV